MYSEIVSSLKNCIIYILLKAPSLYSSRTEKCSRFHRSGAAAGKLASPALQFVLGLLSCLVPSERSDLVGV